MRKLGLFSLALLIICVITGLPAYAQVGTSNLTGTVKDDQGNPLPGATVTAKNTDTGLERIDVTDESGLYRVPSLPFGNYDVSAKIEGFATQIQKGVRLDVGKTTYIDFGMKLSTTAETMEITAEVPLIEKTESHISTVVTPEQVENLPLNGRQFANLAALAPGTTLGFHPDPTRPTNLAVSSIGGSGRNVNVTIDGGDNNDDTVGGLNQMFSLESIAEFNYLQNRYKAEYGRSSGGVLNVVTKSGTNSPHGSFFSLFRDDALNSLSTSEENAGFTDPAPFSREHYGGSFGGPIVQDRAHFFVAAERLQDDVISIVDTGGIAPALDGPVEVPTRDTQVTAKFTSNLNPEQYLSVRYGYQKSTSIYGSAPYVTANARGTLTNKFNSVLASHNYVISDDMLNEFSFQYADFDNAILPTSTDPSIVFPSGVYIGQNINTPQTTIQKKYQFRDDLSWAWRGNHHFKGGVNFVHEPTLGGSFSTGVQAPQFTPLEDRLDSPIATINQNGGVFGNEAPNNQIGLYVQDDWNVNEKLTLNLGVRYDFITGFDLNQSTNPLYAAIANSPYNFPWIAPFREVSDATLQNDGNNIAPRLGGAYDLKGDGQTVVRGGWGLYYDFPYTNANILFPGAALGDYGTAYFVSDPNGIRNPDGTLFKIGDPLPPNQLPGLASNPPNDVASPDFVVPYTNQYSIGVAHQLSNDVALDVDYIHTSVRDQYVRFRANGLIDGVRAFPAFGNFRVWYNGGESDYDGLNITFRGRATNRIQFQAAYTLSKAEGNTL
ncbi:MAG TPA: TonB-dependent receptor, partial [Acidobacteriota bacterium]|nr:TonB-dependent receptor [Acidobacteriota bacterium]